MKQNGLMDKIFLVADPAFQMAIDENKNPHNTIGINISLLSLNHISDDIEKSKINLFNSLEHLINNTSDYDFLLIPHVMTSNGGSQDDNEIINEFYEFSNNKDKLKKLPYGLGAIETKKNIKSCKILFAARMHCAVAGISSNVPTVMLTYSIKGTGMVNYAYGNSEMSVNLKNLTKDDLYEKYKFVIDNYQTIKDNLEINSHKFLEDSNRAAIDLKNLL